jgi:hypothetical protein
MTKTASGQSDATHASSEAPTFLEIIIDETGSMSSVKAQTIQSFNDFIKDQKALPGECLVSMTKFSTDRISTPYESIGISMVPNLTSATFCPNGMTNLYDTILDRITKLRSKVAATPCNVLFLVLTDGDDNSSRSHRSDVVQELGTQMEAGWTFVYLGAHGNALNAALAMGFPEGNIKAFSNVDVEVAAAMAATSNATTMYRSARASGAVAVATSSSNYFSGE